MVVHLVEPIGVSYAAGAPVFSFHLGSDLLGVQYELELGPELELGLELGLE